MNEPINKFNIKCQKNQKKGFKRKVCIIGSKWEWGGTWTAEDIKTGLKCKRTRRQGQKFTSTSRRVKSALVRPAF